MDVTDIVSMDKLDESYFDKLAEPFPPDIVEWRPGSVSHRDEGSRALALAYTDSRHYFARLSEVFGADWRDDYEVKPLHDRVFIICRLNINGTVRTDVGEELLMEEVWDWQQKQTVIRENANALTTACAQAFKRACVKHGLGAFFYTMPKLWADYDKQKKRFTDKGLVYLNGAYRDWLKKEYNLDMAAKEEPETTPEEEVEMTPEEAAAMLTKKGGTALGDCTADQLGIVIEKSKGELHQAACLLLDILAEQVGPTAPKATYNRLSEFAGGD